MRVGNDVDDGNGVTVGGRVGVSVGAVVAVGTRVTGATPTPNAAARAEGAEVSLPSAARRWARAVTAPAESAKPS